MKNAKRENPRSKILQEIHQLVLVALRRENPRSKVLQETRQLGLVAPRLRRVGAALPFDPSRTILVFALIRVNLPDQVKTMMIIFL